jgi:hypothetical protein
MMSALFRFHMQVGIRLALRILIPVVSVFFAAYYLLRPELFNFMMAQILDAGFLLSGLCTAAFCLVIAFFTSRRVCLGLNGWIRHLPVEGAYHRRMAGIAILIAQVPILTILAALAIIAAKLYGASPLPYLIGLPFTGLSCGLCVLPTENKFLSGTFAALAGITFASNDWRFLALGFLLLVAADALSGPMEPKKRHPKFRGSLKGTVFVQWMNWRALGWRVLIPYLLSLPFLGFARLFIVNNDPGLLLSAQMVRFGGASSLILFCAAITNMLAARRPPWPWVRSLPWSAKKRIFHDSFFVGIPMLPILIVTGTMSRDSLLPLIASFPLFAAFSAYAMRLSPGSKGGAAGKILLLGLFCSLSLCLIPWSSLFFLGITPLVLLLGTKAEKHQKISRWLELHHLAAGDSLSWSVR